MGGVTVSNELRSKRGDRGRTNEIVVRESVHIYIFTRVIRFFFFFFFFFFLKGRS